MSKEPGKLRALPTKARGTSSIAIVSLGAVALTEPGCGFPVGGSELQQLLLARKLAATDDLATTLYVADMGQGAREEGRLRICPVIAMGPGLRLTAWKAWRLLRRLAKARHDLYVTRSASGLNGLTTLAAHWAKAKHLHMCAHDNEASGHADATLSALARRLHHYAINKADGLTCQTAAQCEALRRRYGRNAILAPNLAPLPEAKPSVARRGALWVGRDVSWKRPEVFLELARRLPEFPFTMVCQPQPEADITRLAAAAPENLAFHPGLPFHETARLYATHQVLVCTSESEGFPNTFLQSAAAGTPVLSLKVDPEGLIANFQAGGACDDDVDALAAQTRRALTDPEHWAMGHAGAMRLYAHQRERETQLVDTLRELAARS